MKEAYLVALIWCLIATIGAALIGGVAWSFAAGCWFGLVVSMLVLRDFE